MGGAVYGGVLHGIVFRGHGMTEHHFIENDGYRRRLVLPYRGNASCQNGEKQFIKIDTPERKRIMNLEELKKRRGEDRNFSNHRP